MTTNNANITNASRNASGMIEMARVAQEVRIFPLLMLGNAPSPHVAPVRAVLGNLGYEHEVRTVPYEFQKGGNQMLVVRRPVTWP